MPLTTTEAEILKIAKPYCPIEARVLPRRRYPYLCGFVTFETLDTAQGFISAHHMKASLGGVNPLTVRFSDGKNATKKVFFGSLGMNMSEESLRALVAPYGTCLAVNILSKKKRSPCGFVTFATPEQATNCIENLNGKINDDGAPYYVVKFGEGVSEKNEKDGEKSRSNRGESKRSRDDDDYRGDSGAKRRRRNDDNYHNTAAEIPHEQDQWADESSQNNMAWGNVNNGFNQQMKMTQFNNAIQSNNAMAAAMTACDLSGNVMNMNALNMANMMMPQQVMMNVPIMQDANGNVVQMNGMMTPSQQPNMMFDNNIFRFQHNYFKSNQNWIFRFVLFIFSIEICFYLFQCNFRFRFDNMMMMPMQQSVMQNMPMQQSVVPQMMPQMVQPNMVNPMGQQLMGSPSQIFQMNNMQNQQQQFMQPMQQDPFCMQNGQGNMSCLQN